MKPKIITCFLVFGLTIFGIIFLVNQINIDSNEKNQFKQVFKIDAIYYNNSSNVEIHYLDTSNNTSNVVMEILGMKESFQKTFTGSEFMETVAFSSIPKYGWPAHPIVFEVDHEQFGHVQIKTEIHSFNEPIPHVIYSRP